ncbi:ricin-type beta-trefoil lectin domain protein [Kitasatospora sp. NPDC092286]
MEYNGTQYDQDKPAAGYCGYVDAANPCEKVGRTRAYFQIGLNSQFWNSTVLSARLYANVVRSSSPSTSTPMGLYSTGSGNSNPINQWTRWNAQPCQTGAVMQNCGKVGMTLSKGTGGIEFDVYSQMTQAAREHWGGWTFGFAPDDESNKYYRQRFANNPHVVVVYDIAPYVGSPATSPTPGFASNSDYNNPCRTPGTTNPWDNPGWIGANTDINLSVDTRSPTNEQLWTTFKIWDDDNGGSAAFSETGWAASSGRVTRSVGSLIDGHQYGWFAVTDDGTLHSDYSDMCFMRIDRTPPTAQVTSTDFPESGTLGGHPKAVGEEGSFVLTGTDPAPAAGGRSSGLACARWTADPVQAAATGWNCNDGGNVVKMNANGKYVLKVKPDRWGTHFLYLQTQDNAGNMSQPVVYTYYVPSNPNAPAPIMGDIDGDKKADVLLPDGAGNLRLVGANADPFAAPNAKPESAPNTTSWGNVQVTHRGSFSSRNVDDMIAHAPGAAELYLYANDETAAHLDGQSSVQQPKSRQCALPDTTPITCADYGNMNDWSAVTQISAFGSPSGDSPEPTGTGLPRLPRSSMLFIENGRLWLAMSSSVKQLDGPAVLLSQNNQDWNSYDLITPGPAKGTDMPTVWARSKNDGSIHAYQLSRNASGFDTAAFADPTKGWLANGVDPKLYPKVGSNGDLTGDGVPDLWAVDNNQQLVAWAGIGTKAPGTDKSGPTVTGLASAPVVLGNLNRPVGNWLAAPNGGNSVVDGQGKANGTASGVGWVADTVGGRPTTVAAFSPGNGSNITMTGPVVDTRRSFTVSAWAKSGPAGGVIASQNTGRASSFMLYSDAGRTWTFALAKGDDDGWPYDWTNTVNTNAAVRTGVWTQLSASYNADTGLMSLYVDGVLAATGYHKKSVSPPSSGPFVLGRYQYQGKPSSAFDGSVSSTAVYPFAVSPAAPGTSGLIRSGVDQGMCADDNGFGTADGTAIQLWTCHGDTSQQFSLGNDGSVRVLGGCLTPVSAGRDNGTKMEYRTCNGTESQKWIPLANNALFHPDSGRCLDLPAWSAVNGNRLQLWDCHFGASQQWVTSTLRTAVLPAPPRS